jgi:threonine dehydrogenase-like Zn-dependent dehydrogenase
MPDTMRALQIESPENVAVVEATIPTAGPGELLVKVQAVTACTQWDLTLLAGKDIFERPDYPVYPIPIGVPGHEMAGDVVAVGTGVTELRVGDRVAAWSSRASQAEGRFGYYADFAAVPEDCLLKIPDHLSYVEAAPLELAMCVAASVRQAGDLAGKDVAIGGAGPAGLIAIQMVRTLGARTIIAFDPIETRRSLALELGADLALDPGSSESLALDSSATDIAIECAGAAASAENLMRVTSGGVHLFGVVHGEIRYNMSHWGRNVSLRGYPGHTLESAEYALAMMAKGAVRTGPIIGAEVDFDTYKEGIDMLRVGSIAKLCVRP